MDNMARLPGLERPYSDLQDQIRSKIHNTLPPHMWPFWIITFPSMAEIPVTPNGKLNVPDLVAKCKAILGRTHNENFETVFSEDEVRELVVCIWKLALPHSVPYNSSEILLQHFLTLGGSSLSVLWCVEKIIVEFGMY
jgi:hypothetical protein